MEVGANGTGGHGWSTSSYGTPNFLIGATHTNTSFNDYSNYFDGV